jgi:hypothetical protein
VEIRFGKIPCACEWYASWSRRDTDIPALLHPVFTSLRFRVLYSSSPRTRAPHGRPTLRDGCSKCFRVNKAYSALSVFNLNRGEITYLGYSPFEISRVFQLHGSLGPVFPWHQYSAISAAIETRTSIPTSEDVWEDL